MATLSSSALVDADGVQEIIDTELTDSRVHNFINMAAAITVRLVGKLDACGGEATRTEIERLLAAHFLTMYERTVKSENIAGEWSVTYAMKDGLGLDASRYGQDAKVLDCSGILAGLGQKQARFAVTSYYQTYDSEYLFDEDFLH